MFDTTQQLSLKENELECHELAGRAPNYQSRQVLTRLAMKIQKTRGLMKFSPLLQWDVTDQPPRKPDEPRNKSVRKEIQDIWAAIEALREEVADLRGDGLV